MTDAHAKDDVKELDDAGHLPVIMQFGHQDADRIKPQTQPMNPEQNPLPFDIGETLYVYEYAWVKNAKAIAHPDQPDTFLPKNRTPYAQAVALDYAREAPRKPGEEPLLPWGIKSATELEIMTNNNPKWRRDQGTTTLTAEIASATLQDGMRISDRRISLKFNIRPESFTVVTLRIQSFEKKIFKVFGQEFILHGIHYPEGGITLEKPFKLPLMVMPLTAELRNKITLNEHLWEESPTVQHFTYNWLKLLRPMCLAVHNAERALLAEGVARAECEINVEDWLPNHMITVSIAQQGKSERQLRAIATYLSRNTTVRIMQRDDKGHKYLLFTALIVNISSNRSGIPLDTQLNEKSYTTS